MNKDIQNENRLYFYEYLIILFALGMFFLTVFIIVDAAVTGENTGEASMGSFDLYSFGERWELEHNGSIKSVDLPLTVDAKAGDTVTLRNTIPDDISDNSSLMVRESMQDIYIYIDGVLRDSFMADDKEEHSYYLHSAYVVVPLDGNDRGKNVEIKVDISEMGRISEVTIGPGNNVWFPVINENIVVTVAAFVILIVGIVFSVSAGIVIIFTGKNRGSIYLGFFIIETVLWILFESRLRQLFFNRPTMTGVLCYMALEMLSVFAALYFDEIQHKRYSHIYLAMESVSTIIMIVNIILHVTGTVRFYDTLVISNSWLGIELAIVLGIFVKDVITHDIREYKIVAMGMCGFIPAAALELIVFYFTDFNILGLFICIGLLVLMMATVIQVIMSISKEVRESQDTRSNMLIDSVETLAGAIDAKDEYTGGHSERVGEYVAVLARGMAADYDFSEDDILRIHYIGVMHDIGKIGVADTILNKDGRLDDNEFEMMKKHVLIGADLMGEYIDISIRDLVDGIKYHHERFDGKGYPEGLSETDIPLIARMLCIADCYDAMTSNRVYRKRLSDEEVRKEIVRCAGTQFDPAIADIFVRLMDEGEICPVTVSGMSVSEEGKVQKSSLLEKKLHEMSRKRGISTNNPSHLRMLYFIMKLLERRGDKIDSYILEDKDGGNDISRIVSPFMKAWDVCVRYNDSISIVVLFGKDEDEIRLFRKAISGLNVV
ncbi:MAG: HD-GYP domain-containing protein [Lachnospiraceae bacterium]|nr:HD-GYP domain-containing protein [Lachnospiraceae bacterium]